MSIAANKHKGIRAGLCGDTESAKLLKNYLYQNKTPEDSDIEKSSDEMSKDKKDDRPHVSSVFAKNSTFLLMCIL